MKPNYSQESSGHLCHESLFCGCWELSQQQRWKLLGQEKDFYFVCLTIQLNCFSFHPASQPASHSSLPSSTLPSFYSFHPSFQSSLQMSVHFPFQTSFQNPFIPAIFLPYLLSSLFASRLPSFFPSCIHEYFKRWHWVMMIQCHTTVRLPGSNPGPVFFIHMPLGNLLKFPILEISSFFM